MVAEIYRIKPLEWVEARVSDRWERYSADSIVGRYEVLEWSNGGYGGTMAPVGDDDPGVEFTAQTMDEAKAMAQEDFNQRIYSAIEFVD